MFRFTKSKSTKFTLKIIFYEFQEDYIKASDELYWKEHNLENCKVTIALGNSENFKPFIDKDEIEYALENKPKLEKSIDSLNRVIDSLTESYISGDLYAAKMLFKDRFGGVNRKYVFKVYYYDKDKILKMYDGKEKYNIRNASFSYHDENFGCWFFEDW